MKQIATLALALLLLTGLLISGIPVYASVEESGGGSGEEESTGGGDESGGGGGSDEGPVEDPIEAPIEDPIEDPVEPPVEEPPVIPESPVHDIPTVEDPIIPLPGPPDLPICDGTPVDCITNDGNVCLKGQGGHECECEEDMSDCPNHPSLKDGPIHPCLLDPADPICPKPDPITGDCPEGYAQNEDGNCFLLHPNGCPKGYHGHEDDETGRCIPDSTPCDPGYIRDPDYPTCSKKGDICEKHPWLTDCGGNGERPCDPETDENCEGIVCPAVEGTDCIPGPRCKEGFELVNGKCVEEEDDDDRHKVIIKNINIRNTIHNTADFPEVDVIGLSVKNTGEAAVCMMNIDNDWVQCQEFGVPNDRINENIWRVIETDRDKNYDNGNTGSEDVDSAIGAIKSQDFTELDDLNNHDFNVDLAALGINPAGDGLVCLIEDDRNEGTALCEPFKVSSEAISGQITEITEIEA